jgi:DNA-binding CsgD family transcriptional regulator/PAS domain-containing protein
MDMQLEQFSTTVGHIYEAGLDPDKWPVALESLCTEMGADKAQMIYLDTAEHMISFASSFGFDPFSHDINAGRFRRYLAGDPIAQYGMSHLNEVFSDRRVIDTKVLHESGMQQDIRNPEDMQYMLTSFITDGSSDLSGICFFRREDQEAFDSNHETALNRYVPHIRRSTSIHKSIAGVTHDSNIQNAILENLDTGILVIDENHEVLLCNKRARLIIGQTDAMKIGGTRLSGQTPRENTLLHQSIDQALNLQVGSISNRKIAIQLTSKNGSQSILAVTTPMQFQKLVEVRQNLPLSKAHYTASIPCKKNVLITLCDPRYYGNKPAEMLEQLFGLTPAEAALAECLASDRSLDLAAKILGRSVGTARVQLQSIFEKTDTNRQSSLVRLIMAIP